MAGNGKSGRRAGVKDGFGVSSILPPVLRDFRIACGAILVKDEELTGSQKTLRKWLEKNPKTFHEALQREEDNWKASKPKKSKHHADNGFKKKNAPNDLGEPVSQPPPQPLGEDFGEDRVLQVTEHLLGEFRDDN